MTQIILDGVDKNQKKTAETEIKRVLNAFFSDRENPVDSIAITKRFQKTIQQFLKISGKEMTYDPHHEYGTACAKTIPYIKEGKLAFVIVLDGNLFGKWTDENYFSRIATLAHELIHVNDDMRRWTEIGTKEFFAEPKGKRGRLLHNAWIVWEEYKANRVVAEFFEDFAKEREGRVDYGFALGHAETLYNLLEDIQDYIKQSIRDFRYWKLTPTEICYRITSRICGILLLCAYTYALVDLSGELKERTEEIEKLEGYQFLLFNNWPKIHSILNKLYSNAKKYLPELVNRIADEIDAIIQRCGLDMRDTEQGLWVDVHDPD